MVDFAELDESFTSFVLTAKPELAGAAIVVLRLSNFRIHSLHHYDSRISGFIANRLLKLVVVFILSESSLLI